MSTDKIGEIRSQFDQLILLLGHGSLRAIADILHDIEGLYKSQQWLRLLATSATYHIFDVDHLEGVTRLLKTKVIKKYVVLK